MRIGPLLALSLFGLAAAGPALAVDDTDCPERSHVLNYLADQYDEDPIAVGVANNGDLIEVLSARNGETWTILVTTPRGRSCLVAAGHDWQDLPEVMAEAQNDWAS
jgi:hypothetical protein